MTTVPGDEAKEKVRRSAPRRRSRSLRAMTVPDARRWLILASLSLTGGCLVFFLIAPVVGYPLKYPQPFRLLEILLPVFLAYLGSATLFVFGAQESPTEERAVRTELLGLLVRGPVVVFSLAILSALIAFGVSNSESAPPGAGMNLDTLSLAVSSCVGLLAVTTNVAVSYLFGAPKSTEHRQRASPPGDTGAQGGESSGEDLKETR